jgi:predicted amino acid-binding ACT domain protein
MTIKEQLIQEIENIPNSMLGEIFNFVLFLKAKQPQTDFMEFAGMAADIEDVMQEIVEEAEANRQLDLSRINHV